MLPREHWHLLLVLLLYGLAGVLEICQSHLLPRRRLVIINELRYRLHREIAVRCWKALAVLVISSNRVVLLITLACLRLPR